MAENTFKSPGFFDREIEITARAESPSVTPAGIIGTSKKGPAFVPTTVGSKEEFDTIFGTNDVERFGPYAVEKFLANKAGVTFLRVLGAGANTSTTDINNTEEKGTVKNAGFRIDNGDGDATTLGQRYGVVQFLAAKHTVSANSDVGFPSFTDNDSFPALRESTAADDTVHLVRAVLLTTTGSLFFVQNHNASIPANQNSVTTDIATTNTTTKKFRLLLYSEKGAEFATTDGKAGFKVYNASLDPDDKDYIGKILNTDPTKFDREQHLLYLDYAVEDELASVVGAANAVAILSGSASTSDVANVSDKTYRSLFGRFDTRYTTPKTTTYLSQPFGKTEYDLFHFETLSDGAMEQDKIKVSITNLKASIEDNYKYGSFNVQVRRLRDTDPKPEILEEFINCSLDPSNERFVGRLIGDRKVKYNFDADLDEEKRLVVSGRYPNVSRFIRIVINDSVYKKDIPETTLPFGFKGIPALKTSPMLTNVAGADMDDYNRLSGRLVTDAIIGSIIPPLPLRFKVTRGSVSSSPYWVGDPGLKEKAREQFYWGVKTDRIVDSARVSDGVLNSNVSSQFNNIIDAYSKFQGISKLDTMFTGSDLDTFNNNKFTLGRVALIQTLTSDGALPTFTGSIPTHMKDAAYIRNGVIDQKTYQIPDPIDNDIQRLTLATILNSSATTFNKFSGFAKFTNIFHGGFDGVNILNKDLYYMNDRASSQNGFAGDTITGGLGFYGSADQTGGEVMLGTGKNNGVVASYRTAIEIMTDPMASNINILAIPGIRDSYVTDYAVEKNKDYSMGLYVMDIPNFDENDNRLFDHSAAKPDVDKTVDNIASRTLDDNAAAAYFPDVQIEDIQNNNRRINVPASVAALGALAFNDAVSYPWYAPAGFNRGALGFVTNTKTKLSVADRDNLYDNRINPIANFPDGSFVIFGQKTLQKAQSALDRVNVRRLLLEIKRQVVSVANRFVFEQNDSATRERFVAQVSPLLAVIQAQAGVEEFRVICDNTNNTAADTDANRLNGTIIIVPTRAIEFIAIDFIITNSGVSFE